MNRLKSIFLTVIFYITLGHTYGEGRQVLTAEKLWQMERVGVPAVSPDGLRMVFPVTRFDKEINKGFTDLYFLDIETGAKRQFTFTGTESSPVWSPDGTKIAFISRRHNGLPQIYLIGADGGEAQKLTDLPVGVFSIDWFPCGQKIAFGANILPAYNGDFAHLKELIEQKNDDKVTARVTENAMYRFWDRWLTDGYYPRLFKVDINNRQVTDLMPHTSNFGNMMGGISYSISPDGKQIALSFNNTLPPYNRLNSDIFILETDGSGRMSNITAHNLADDHNPVFSPDGRYILYGEQYIYHFYADRVQMIIYNVADGTRKNITGNIDLSCQDWSWSDDSGTIFFHAEHNAATPIFSIPASGGNHTVLYARGTNSHVTPAGRRGEYLVFTHNNFNMPPEIFRIDRRGRNLTQLTDFNGDRLAGIELGKTDNVVFKGANDAEVQMYIIYPPNFDPAQKYPLVHLIHGGPHAIFGDEWHFRWNAHLFAAPGYVVALVNFHGSTSFGQEFAISIHGEHANKPFEDIMRATDFMIKRGYIDSTRMAAAGGSYGGYLVSWIAGHTERFAALINHAGVYDLHLQFASDVTGNREYQYGGTPWENFDVLNSQNPSQFAHNFKTPMLIIHGALDYRVPVAHGLLVYAIYKARGLQARLVYFPDENHWILTPRNSIFWYQEVHNWLERFLD